MTEKTILDNPLLAFGLGVGAGATALWAAVELLPLILIGGGVWLAVKGVTPGKTPRENANEVLDGTGDETPNRQPR